MLLVAGFGLPKFSLKPKSSEDSRGGIVLLSSRALGSKQPAEKGGITLLSKKPIDHGYSDFEGKFEGWRAKSFVKNGYVVRYVLLVMFYLEGLEGIFYFLCDRGVGIERCIGVDV